VANRDMTSKVKAARIVLIVASQVGRPSICISGPFCAEDNRPEMTTGDLTRHWSIGSSCRVHSRFSCEQQTPARRFPPPGVGAEVD
jgi:hypothetical protein